MSNSKVEDIKNISLPSKNPSEGQPFHQFSLLDIGQYRIKEHCHSDPALVHSQDYLILQHEILENELINFYQGSYIFEVWTKTGEKIFQKILREQCKNWKLCNNVLVFKTQIESPLIYIIWLNERKMAAVRHPFEDNKEVDFIYFEDQLIIASKNSVKIIEIKSSESKNNLLAFQVQDDNTQLYVQKEASGVISKNNIHHVLLNPFKYEILLIATNDLQKIVPLKFQIDQNSGRKITLVEVELDAQKQKKSNLDKKAQKLLSQVNEPLQVQVIVKNQVPYLVVLRQNNILEILENFQQTIQVEQITNLQRLLPSFGEQLTFQFNDGTISQAQSLDKIAERNNIQDSDYYGQLALPPKSSSLHDIVKLIHFYSDMIIVNQNLFLLRDNIIFNVDIETKKVKAKYLSAKKIVGLYKLREIKEDPNGFKQTSYKVYGIAKIGSLIMIESLDQNLNKEWFKNDIGNTQIIANKEQVQYTFQNQNALSCLYISTLNNAQEQKLYQLQYNGTLIDLQVKFAKTDKAFSVFAQTRTRELIGVVDQRSFSVYKFDQNVLQKLYSISTIQNELKDLESQGSMAFMGRDYILAFAKDKIHKINTRSNIYESIKLHDGIQTGNNLFIDSNTYYFLAKGENSNHSKLAIITNDMIHNGFNENTKVQAYGGQDDDKEQKTLSNKIYYPFWSFAHNIKRLDYDEFNGVVNLILSNFEIVQVPLYHRNTTHFLGMGERTFYLCFKQYQDTLYALDKENFMNAWSMINGKMISRTKLQIDKDYTGFDVDRKLYDKDWFPFTLIHKLHESQAKINFNIYKIIDIDERGQVIEKLTFKHSQQVQAETHFYFSLDLAQMIELIIKKDKSDKVTYNLYNWTDNEQQKWSFIHSLNLAEKAFNEWHKKTLYPYSINLKTFKEIDLEKLEPQFDYFKYTLNDKIKVYNPQDGIEMLFDPVTGQMQSYLALQYSFATTKDSFYDKKCGQFFINESSLRIQSYYENYRRSLFLENIINNSVRTLDVSTRDFKHKYVIDQAFTYFDYRFYIQYIENDDKQALSILKSLSSEQFKRLIHNIFPDKNNTLLHFISMKNKSSSYEIIDYLDDVQKKEKYVVPFIRNVDDQTPLDYVLKTKDHKQANSLIKLISKGPMDHHSRLIAHIIPQLIEIGVPALEKYFDKRKFSPAVFQTINLGRLKIKSGYDHTSAATKLFNETEDSIKNALMNPDLKTKEQSISIKVWDLPLTQAVSKQNPSSSEKDPQLAQGLTKNNFAIFQSSYNAYEIQIVKALANTENTDIFQQDSIRAFIDFLWPQSRSQIIQNLLLPYLAFIFYYMIYLIVLKRLNITQQKDEAYYNFTSGMFVIYNYMFQIILFLGCFYFFYQDFLQIKSFSNNKIVLWAYANICPLIIMLFIIIYDYVVDINSPQMEKGFYSAASFFIWIRVFHLMKCFTQTAYIIRMATQIIYRMRNLILFNIILLFAFGFTFFFLSDDATMSPYESIEYMFLMMFGSYNPDDFSNTFLKILFVGAMCINVFFVFTMLVGLSVQAFSQDDSDAWSNEAYRDKAALIAQHSYLLQEKPVRDVNKNYLMIASVTEYKKQKGSRGQGGSSGSAQDGSLHQNYENKKFQGKIVQSIDLRMNLISNRVDKAMKEIQEKINSMESDQKQRSGSRH